MNQVYYSSTSELPMFNWNQINKTHDWKHLIKNEAPSYLKKSSAFNMLDVDPEDIWNKIWIGYIDKHGLNTELEHWFSIMKEVCRLRLEVHLYGKKYMRPMYRAKEVEGEDVLKALQGGSQEENDALISKNLGYRVDTKTTSVDQYMAYIKISSNGKG